MREVATLHAYGANAARHYAAYRPPLHREILSRALGERRFGKAMDIGCGTGQSAVALIAYSGSITAIDKSAEMLAAAREQTGICYRLGDETHLPVASKSVDLVTMAGVLPYLDLAALSVELKRVCRAHAILLSYDFRVDLEAVSKLFLPDGGRQWKAYDHGANLDGVEGIAVCRSSETDVSFNLSAREAGHLLLASETRFDELIKQAGQGQAPLEFVEQTIRQSSFPGCLKARLFWSLHRFVP